MTDFAKGSQIPPLPLPRGGKFHAMSEVLAGQEVQDAQVVGLGFDQLTAPGADSLILWDESEGNVTFVTPGITAVGLTDPGADRIVFWDDSAGSLAYLTPGTGLSITATTLNASGVPWNDGNPVTLETASDRVRIGPSSASFGSAYRLATTHGSAASDPALVVQNTVVNSSVRVATFIGGTFPNPPSDGDEGYLSFYLYDTATVSAKEFARMTWQANDVTSTTKDGEIRFATQVNNSLTDRVWINEVGMGIGVTPDTGAIFHAKVATDANFKLSTPVVESTGLSFEATNDAVSANVITEYRSSKHSFQVGGIIVGSPTGGHKGAGTINATAVYDDNTLLTDWVFDLHFDGRVRPEDRPRHADARLLSIDETRQFADANRHLPTVRGRDEWQQNQPSIGELSTMLLETIERQQLQIFELDERLQALEDA